MARRVAVLGGGISGLTAARELARADSTAVVLIDGAERLGGKIRSRRIAGAVVEDGPDWFITANPAAVELCREVGLGNRLVEPRAGSPLIWRRGRLLPAPRGFVRGVPASVGALARARGIGAAAKSRALADVVLPGPLTGPDISIGRLVRRRFGQELLEAFVDPLLAASRSGDADRLSLAAAAPEIDAAARSARSVMTGLRRTGATRPTAPMFLGLAGGMEELVTALGAELGDTKVVLRTPVAAVRRTERGFSIEPPGVVVEGVVVALPAPAAAAVLRDLDAGIAAELGEIRYSSGAIACLRYPPGAVDPPPGSSGFLVPATEHRKLTACAWFSHKWSHAVPDDGGTILRCFAGRLEDDPSLARADADLVAVMASEAGEALGIESPPVETTLTRWNRALPVLEVGHLDRVARIEQLARSHPGLAVAGAAYRGAGLPDCIESGRRAARIVLAGLEESPVT